jgi:SAM-dependent methyltransferase
MKSSYSHTMSIYQKVLGHPIVYERIRPFIVGGVEMSPAYRNLEAGPEDVIVDVGCGTGDALEYLTSFRAYHGFDNDPVAIDYARRRAANRANVTYEARILEAVDLARIQPTRIMMAGLLHHLPDEQAVDLLKMCGAVPTLMRIATQDVVFLPGELVSNFFARLDRGKFVRKREGFIDLVRAAGLKVVSDEVVRSHPTNGRARYLLMAIERA